MAAMSAGLHFLILKLLLFPLIAEAQSNIPKANEKCTIPQYYHGNWYSQEGGKDIDTLINSDEWTVQTEPSLKLQCIQEHTHDVRGEEQDGKNMTLLMKEVTSDANPCYFCVDILWRTKAILQYRREDCVKQNSGVTININVTCKALDPFYGLPTTDETFTLFKKDPPNINCITSFEGVYQFSYEVDQGGGGICNNPNSQIKACQDPGSPYVDNQVFMMTFAKCSDVSTSRDDQIRYQCLGSWFAVKSGVGYTYAAIMDTVEGDPREVYKCLMTLRNQKDAKNQIRWVMSRFADCNSLNSIYFGPLKLVLTRIPPPTPYMSPKCNLPRNITGTWTTQGIQYRSDFTVNDTHVVMNTKINEFEYQEAYYSCQQTLGTRYLMTKVVVGKCEVDFVCFDIMPRHHSIVRYRVGKPNRLTEDEKQDPNFLIKKFREACSWISFTFNRDDTDWKYEVLILNPPTPVPCPIAGRYYFEQKSVNKDEEYVTRIRGVTLRPRIQVDCRITVAEFKSCSTSMDKIEVDSEYCETVDYRGRPIGEYDVSDHILTCVGFWMEDYRSYLITWDEEDAISNFRCWVYERQSWTDVAMSRSQNARCPRGQQAQDYLMPGTGLSLRLSESERLFDDCPQRFDPGFDPYKKPTTIFVLSGSSYVQSSGTVICLLIAFLFLFH